MSDDDLQQQLEEAQETIRSLQTELKETTKGIIALTLELQQTQEELVRKEKLAILGQLAGGVAHELRNPLGAIKNAIYFLNMVLEEPEPDIKETLDILEREVTTSVKIIDSLLDFAHQKSPIRKKLNINDIVRMVLSHSTVPENIDILYQLDKALPPIQVDSNQFDLVFGNIIRNAIQAMPKGGQLTVKSEVPSPEWVAISFIDTGTGISEENMGKLFEPLFTTKAKGIGLGLPIAETLIKAHGGAIEMQSEVGKGSIFTVRLPVDREEINKTNLVQTSF